MSGRIRVMQVVECGGPGGTGNQVAALCRGLDPKRFETHLVYAVRPGSTPEDYESLAAGAEACHHIPEMVREIRPLSDAAAWWKLFRLFRRLGPGVVHAHSSKAGVLARTAALAAGVPCVYYSPRGYGFLQSDRSLLSRTIYREAERAVSWIGEIAAVSESEAELARGLTDPSRVRVVRDAFLGEPAARVRASAPGAPVTVCASGRMSFPRNPEAFARLVRGLANAHPRVRCLWIGGGELEPRVRSLIAAFRLESALEITGWLPQRKAVKRLGEADVFVHYSRWEGLPNAVLEAMSRGLPVVASDIPGNRNVVRHGENGFLARGEHELLERTLELVRDPAARSRMGAQALSLIREEYTLERLIREISDLYS